jgi:hypothetical protein
MLPFRFQIQSVVHHSVGAIEAIQQGVFKPPQNLASHNYQELQGLVADAHRALQDLPPEAVNARAGADVIFEIRGAQIPFTTEGFLLSFLAAELLLPCDDRLRHPAVQGSPGRQA